ncbi:hypothetical protein CXQ80_23990 [Pseudomonas sp. 02C 26]|nr:hypothetical protein CXQ80_23990 [Pseudomonas sp. 02C 26]
MHGVLLLVHGARADRSSAEASLSGQQVHTVIKAGKPMLHGPTQVTIAPGRKTSAQYAETDRLMCCCTFCDASCDRCPGVVHNTADGPCA